MSTIEKNEFYTMTIDDIGEGGEGIGKVDGYTLFVKDALIGDEIKVKVIKAKKNYGFGKLIEIITPSPYRIQPPCPISEKCGGCQLQPLSYKQQLKYKENKVKGALERIGGFKDIQIEPIIGMEEPFFYRNKAQFPVGQGKEGEIKIGYYASRSHHIIETEKCYISDPINEKIISIVKEYMETYKIKPYDEEKHKGLVRHILTRVGFHTKEIMVCVVINGEDLPHKEVLVERLKKITKMTSISININKVKTNVILGDQIKTLWGKPYITDRIGNIKYQISPPFFLSSQPNANREVVSEGFGICWAFRRRNSMGYLLWYWFYFFVFGSKGKTGLWC
jgi:23S rRNA (uracil1939-C5)-methyltransferase